MEQIKTFALMLVFCAAAGLIYYLLLPAGKVSDTAKSVFSAILLLAVLLPLFSFAGMELPAFTAAPPETDAENTDILLAAVRQQIEQTVEALVRQFTDQPYETELTMHSTEDNGINIEQIRLVFFTDFSEREPLMQALTEALGAATEVVIRETH